MAILYSQYASGVQLTAGEIVGSSLGVSGLNSIVDRLNSISTDDNLITGSMISGTNTNIFATSLNTNLNYVSGYSHVNYEILSSTVSTGLIGSGISIATTGGPVLVNMDMTYTIESGTTPQTLFYGIARSGTSYAISNIITKSHISDELFFYGSSHYSWIDLPPSGINNYYVVAKRPSTGIFLGSVDIFSISAIELKV